MRRRLREGSNSQLVYEARVAALKDNWVVLILLGALGTAMTGLTLVFPFPVEVRWFLVGMVCTTIIGGARRGIDIAAGHHNGVLGDSAERSTARAVCGHWHRRRGWTLIENLFFDRLGDVDGVLIGPGGVYAIETKWTTELWTLTPEGLAGPAPGRDPLAQARQGAAKIERLLRYGTTRLDVTVSPVVVIWGPGTPDIPTRFAQVDGVTVVQGRWARAFHHRLFRQDRLPAATQAEAVRILSELHDDQCTVRAHPLLRTVLDAGR